jgi:hypothetical protein
MLSQSELLADSRQLELTEPLEQAQRLKLPFLFSLVGGSGSGKVSACIVIFISRSKYSIFQTTFVKDLLLNWKASTYSPETPDNELALLILVTWMPDPLYDQVYQQNKHRALYFNNVSVDGFPEALLDETFFMKMPKHTQKLLVMDDLMSTFQNNERVSKLLISLSCVIRRHCNVSFGR